MNRLHQATGLGLLFLVLVAPSIAAQTWYESYYDAEEALADERWGEAARHLNAALEKRPESSAKARTYGMRIIPYFPYLKLGVAYYHLGQIDAALQAFETEQSQGEIDRSAENRKILQEYRALIEQARQDAEADKQRRASQIVADDLAAARDFEKRGELDDALNALSRVLAVADDQPETRAMQQRLLAALDERDRQAEVEERFSRLVEQGRAELAAREYSQAAVTFSEALDLKQDDTVEGLLRRAEQSFRAEIEARQDEEQRGLLLRRSLARAAELEGAGELRQALVEVQAALFLDSENVQAKSLQQRLIDGLAVAEEDESRSATIRRLLTEVGDLLRAGATEQALNKVQRVLYLDKTNRAALQFSAQGFAQLSDALLATDSAPPAVFFDAPDHVALLDGGGWVVRSPALVLKGTVHDSTPVELSFLDAGTPIEQVTIEPNEVQGRWFSEFTVRHRLPAGLSTIEVVAVDRAGNTTTEQRSFEYVVPFVRSVWFPASIAGAFGCVVLGVIRWRARRRRQLLERRFNPYVAGAPILEQERFFGRRRLLEYVLRRIHNNSILLYGERRIGKTSFQHQLKQRLTALEDPTHEFFPVFIDLQGTPEEKFFATLATEIFHELGSRLGGLQPNPAIEQDSYGYRQFVQDIHGVLKALKTGAKKKIKLVLLIDEVDELNDYDPRINQKLRSLFMRTFADSLVSVVSGVAIKKHWEREGSPWYNFFQEIEVEPLDNAEAVALVEAPVRGVFAFEKGAADEILRKTECKPYLIQRLCSVLVDRLHEDRRRNITLEDVENVSHALETQ